MTKRIILVLASPPLPFGKADSHWYYVLLKELVARGHHVSAFVACETRQELEQTQALFPAPDYEIYCDLFQAPRWSGKLRSLRRPYSYMFSPAFRQALAKRLAAPYDVLHLEQLWSGWLGLHDTRKAIVTVHYLFSEDRTFDSANSWKTQLQGLLSYQAERRLLQTFPQFITLSNRLADRIQHINSRAITHTIPLGIDLSHYPFATQKPKHQAPIVGLIGNFNWAPSYSAAKRLLTQLWSEIKRQVPNAQLHIVGRAAQTRLSAFAALPDVTLFQDVPDILPYFHQMDVMLYAPAAGSGMKVKVMEAFALGTPVVTTSEGIEGLPAQDGIHAGVCDNNAGLVERTITLLNNPLRRETQRHNAHQLLLQYCSPAVTVSQIEQVYQAIAHGLPIKTLQLR